MRQQVANFLKKRHGIMSMRAFALIAGIDDAVLTRMERCLQAVNTEQIEQLARAFKCSTQEVIPVSARNCTILRRDSVYLIDQPGV